MAKRITYLVFGIVSVGLGVVLTTLSGLGPDPFSYTWIGIQNTFGVTMGQANYIFSALMLLVPLIFNRKLINIGTILSPIGIGLVVDTFLKLDLVLDSQFIKIVVFLLGVIIFTFGIATYILAEMGVSAYDAIILVLKDKAKIQIATSRIIVDGLLYLLAVLLGAPLMIGPIIFVIITGPILQFFLGKIPKVA